MAIGTAAARKALELDEDLAEAHASLGNVLACYHWDWMAAELEFQRAIELNPRCATAHHWYAEMLCYVKRLDEAVGEIHLAMELDPLSLAINTDAAWVLYCGRQYDAAIEQLHKVLDLEPEFLPARTQLAVTYLGHAGVNILATIMGVTDVDPFILGMTQSAGTLTPLKVAATAVLIAAASNNVVKGIYSYSLADRQTGRQSLALLGALAVAGLLPLFWL